MVTQGGVERRHSTDVSTSRSTRSSEPEDWAGEDLFARGVLQLELWHTHSPGVDGSLRYPDRPQ